MTQSAFKTRAEAFAAHMRGQFPELRIMTDALYTFAYSGDASFYRLTPAAVAIVDSEAELQGVLKGARSAGLPVTFRAAGTSLSGQAVTDGVLAVLGEGFKHIRIAEGGASVTLGPSVIVAEANWALRPFHRKIGPDPASQASCKIGGVVANNSSGMCCGVVQNTYHTMRRLRLVLADGTALDSGDAASRAAFAKSRPDLLEGLRDLSRRVRVDNELVDLIRRKYAIKNTVGYSINALIDFDDPVDILTHLMVGSEGTLGFICEVTYETVPDHPHKGVALVPFPTAKHAARGVEALHHVGVSAAEFMERRALATVEDRPAMKPYLPLLTDHSPAVLVEIMAGSDDILEFDLARAAKAMQAAGALSRIRFTKEPAEQSALWDIRKGMFTSAGATRAKGTVMLTEDVAVPIHLLAEAVDDLRSLLDEHGFQRAIIFGHALAGNLHFQMDANFDEPGAKERFGRFNDALAELVSGKFQGSLKAEHGTGRAIAPYVEAEWGEKAYRIMREVKALIEPEGLLNPGVLLNDDREVHLKHLKSMTPVDPIVDMCIECGFCEKVCPSAGMTLTPRQRIAVARERVRLRQTGEDDAGLLEQDRDYVNASLDTCAACNLCSTVCPVGIETGAMVIGERTRRRSVSERVVARLAAASTGAVEAGFGLASGAGSAARAVLGEGLAEKLFAGARRAGFGMVPDGAALRRGPGKPKSVARPMTPARGSIVYVPSCAARMFGAAPGKYDLLPATDAMLTLIARAGFTPLLPEKVSGQCCGQPWTSKGFPVEAENVGRRYADAISAVSGRASAIVIDASTCALHMKHSKLGPAPQDSAEVLLDKILPRLTIQRRFPIVAVHHNCSAQRLKEQATIEALVSACAEKIAPLNSVTCCGFAGDKGLFTPDLNAHALRHVMDDVPEGCDLGVSTVATCAAGLASHTKIPFVSVASLLEYASRPEPA